jgi:mono/diheme cytochrome c family protein
MRLKAGVIGAAQAALVLFIAIAVAGLARQARGEGPGADLDVYGMQVFKTANCVGCHKWSGMGGGGYGGAAASLRKTTLTKDQILVVIRCGRPGTGMPHFQENAYNDGHCYGLKAADLDSSQMPVAPDHYLTEADRLAVATYVVDKIQGRGDPTYAECRAFFGSDSRVCESMPHTAAEAADAGAGGAAPPAHVHLKVEAAPDSNTGKSSQ